MTSGNSRKKAVILGAAGFIGTNLAHSLAARGVQVVCFDRTASPNWPQAAETIEGEFADPPPHLLGELDDAWVFHLIGRGPPSSGTLLAAEEISSDLVSTVRILEQTRSRRLRWIFVSSGGTVYGPNDGERIAESSPTRPVCSYGVAKLTIEHYFALYRRVHGTDYVVARLSNPYGPWQNPLARQGFIAALVHKALTGGAVEIWGDGSVVRDYIFIDDAIEGVIAAAERGQSGDTYNVGTGRGYSLNQLIEIVRGLFHTVMPVTYAPARDFDVPRNVLDIGRLSALTGWAPSTSIEVGISLTAAWLKRESARKCAVAR